jgi:hypothetical protein
MAGLLNSNQRHIAIQLRFRQTYNAGLRKKMNFCIFTHHRFRAGRAMNAATSPMRALFNNKKPYTKPTIRISDKDANIGD